MRQISVEQFKEEHKDKESLPVINICGDHCNKQCNLGGKLIADNMCHSCIFKKGEAGVGCVSETAKIYCK